MNINPKVVPTVIAIVSRKLEKILKFQKIRDSIREKSALLGTAKILSTILSPRRLVDVLRENPYNA